MAIKSLGNRQVKTDGYKLINIEDALAANRDWADMEYNLPPVAEGTKAYNVEAGNFQYAIKDVMLDDSWFTEIHDLK